MKLTSIDLLSTPMVGEDVKHGGGGGGVEGWESKKKISLEKKERLRYASCTHKDISYSYIPQRKDKQTVIFLQTNFSHRLFGLLHELFRV